MPIYTSASENIGIGRLHLKEAEGIASIGRAFYFDANGYQPIYSSEQYLFNYGLVDGYSWKNTRNASLDGDRYSVWETATDLASRMSTKELIDVTSWSKLKAYTLFRNQTYTGGSSTLGIRDAEDKAWVARQAITNTTANSGTYVTFEVDLSGITGDHHIAMQAYCTTAGKPAGFYVYKIWLE